MTSLLTCDLAGVCGGNFLFPTCDEAKQRVAAYRALAADLQGHIDRGQVPYGLGWLATHSVHTAKLDQAMAQATADRMCLKK